MDSTLKTLQDASLNFKLVPVPLASLLFVEQTPSDIYCYYTGKLIKVISQGEVIDVDSLKRILARGIKKAFIYPDLQDSIQKKLSDRLVTHSRGLSMGDPVQNSIKHANLLAYHLDYLIKSPNDDELLSTQFQTTHNFGNFLTENTIIQETVYKDYRKQPAEYRLAHPLLCSIFLLSFIQDAKIYTKNEVHNMFTTCYFKDFGTNVLNPEYPDFLRQNLNKYNADYSIEILNGRVPLNKPYINIIKKYQEFNNKLYSALEKEENTIGESSSFYGLSSTLFNSVELIISTLNRQEMQDNYGLFQVLELLKNSIADEYSQEFKLLVQFTKDFFAKH